MDISSNPRSSKPTTPRALPAKRFLGRSWRAFHLRMRTTSLYVFVVKGVETGNPGLKEINLAVPVFLHTLEESSLSTWIRDSPSIFAYWFILTWHAIGMGLAVGASAVIDLRLLGVAR